MSGRMIVCLPVRFLTVSQKPRGRVYHTPRATSARGRAAGARRALQVLLWQRARDPFAGAWALPGGSLEPGETLEDSIRRHLAAKVDVREVATSSSSRRAASPARQPAAAELATAYLGLVPPGVDPQLPETPPGTPSTGCPQPAFDHGEIVLAGRERLRGKLSYTNVGFALAPATFTLAELREIYAAALGHDVSATNLKRVLLRRGVLEPTGERRARPRRRPARRGLPLPRPRGWRSPIRSPRCARPSGSRPSPNGCRAD